MNALANIAKHNKSGKVIRENLSLELPGLQSLYVYPKESMLDITTGILVEGLVQLRGILEQEDVKSATKISAHYAVLNTAKFFHKRIEDEKAGGNILDDDLEGF